MSSSVIVLLLCAVALVPLAGFFAMVDASLSHVSRARVGQLERDGVRGAARLRAVVDDAPRHISLLLLLQVGAELLATTLVALVSVDRFGVGWRAVLLAAGVMTVVSFVLVGVGPRTLGRQHAYPVALRTAGLTHGLVRVLGPLTRLLILLANALTPGRGYRQGPFASEVELREMVDLAEKGGSVEHGERDMIHSVFELGDTIAREVMVPRTDMVWIEHEKTMRQAMSLAVRSGHSRIPVIGESPDDVLGIVFLKDLVQRSFTLRDSDRGEAVAELMRPAVFVPDSKRLDELLHEMQLGRNHMTILVDEYGGVAGLVTIEDVLEEIVGEIADEYDTDERAPVEYLDDGVVRVSARLPVEDLGELFGCELPAGDVESVGGLLGQALGRVPLPGSEVTAHGLLLRAEAGPEIRGRVRVGTVVVRRATPDAEPESERPDTENTQDSGRRGNADGDNPLNTELTESDDRSTHRG